MGLLALTVTTPVAAQLCWVDSVSTVMDGQRVSGVRVKLMQPGPAMVGVRSATGHEGKAYDQHQGVVLEDGDLMSAANSGHDNCKIEGIVQADRQGVKASAFFMMPGGRTPPEQVESFIEAR